MMKSATAMPKKSAQLYNYKEVETDARRYEKDDDYEP